MATPHWAQAPCWRVVCMRQALEQYFVPRRSHEGGRWRSVPHPGHGTSRLAGVLIALDLPLTEHNKVAGRRARPLLLLRPKGREDPALPARGITTMAMC